MTTTQRLSHLKTQVAHRMTKQTGMPLLTVHLVHMSLLVGQKKEEFGRGRSGSFPFWWWHSPGWQCQPGFCCRISFVLRSTEMTTSAVTQMQVLIGTRKSQIQIPI